MMSELLKLVKCPFRQLVPGPSHMWSVGTSSCQRLVTVLGREHLKIPGGSI